MKIVNAVSSKALSFAIVIIKNDGSEEFSTYHEYAEKLANTLHIKRSIADESETTPEQWMEFFEQRLVTERKSCTTLEMYSRCAKEPVAEIKSYHEYKRDKLRTLIIAKAVERLGDKEYIVEYSYPNYDDMGCGGHGQSRKTYTTQDMLEEIYDDDLSYRRRDGRNYKRYAPSSLRHINTEKELLDSFADHLNNNDCFVQFIGSEENYHKLEQKRRREELEGLASEIARKHKVGVRSVEFLKAVQKEIGAVDYESEEWNNPERRMEEWAAVRYNGLGSDVYFDDLNYVNGKISSRMDDLHGIMEWMAENCPMLYAQYQEESKEEDDETELEFELRTELSEND